MQLKAKNLGVGYGSNKIVFPNINFSANGGDMIALLGVNGIGKSTLLRSMVGLQASVEGVLEIGGKVLSSLSATEKAKLVSIVLTEKIFIENITVRDFIALGRAPYTSWLGQLSEADNAAIENVIRIMGLEKFTGRFFNELSDGERQKVLIARALCQQTPVIILDEPTAFLDFRNKRDILNTLKQISLELDKIIVFSTHDIETSLAYCNKCWIMTEEKEFHEVVKSGHFEEEVKRKLLISSAR
jgi:iron complex transport system ATP-binding protein